MTGTTLNPFRPIAQHADPVRLIQFDGSGARWATGDTAFQIYVNGSGGPLAFDMSDPFERRRTINRVRSLCFSSCGSSLTAASGAYLRCLDLASGVQTWAFEAKPTYGFILSSPMFVCELADRSFIATFDSGVMCHVSRSGDLIASFGHNAMPKSGRMLGDGRRLLGTDGFSVTLWDVLERRKLHQMSTGHRIHGFAVSADGRTFAARSLHTVSVWDTETWKLVSERPSERGLPNLDLSYDGALVAQVSEGSILVTDRNGHEVARHLVEDGSTLCVRFVPKTHDIAFAGSNGTVYRTSAKRLT